MRQILAAFVLFIAAAISHAGPPNIVLILADDLGWADVACNGGDLHETPHIDRLASTGVRFTDAYAAAPVCSPTRASIMTGKSPARLHMTIWYEGATTGPKGRKLLQPVTQPDLSLDHFTLAKALKQAGYTTAHIGKWHLGDAAHYPEAHGFDINIGGTFWGAPVSHFYPYAGMWNGDEEFRYVPGLGLGKPGDYLADKLTDEAIAFIDRAAASGGPFFLNLWHHAVHTPIEGKVDLVEHYRSKVAPGLHHQNPVYAAMVHNLDESVGRVVEALERRGLADNTIIIFTSDNGGYVNNDKGTKVTDNSPLRSGKGSCYEGGLRVPLIVRTPGTLGAVCREPVISTDLYPTVLELAGVKLPSGLDGLSLVPLLHDPAAKLSRDFLAFHYPHYYATTTPVSSLRAGNYTLIHYYEDSRNELYDLASDLPQSKNLAAERPDVVKELSSRLDGWLKATDAQLPTPNPNPTPGSKKKKAKT
jgi:arylsulfatase A-like enzyme